MLHRRIYDKDIQIKSSSSIIQAAVVKQSTCPYGAIIDCASEGVSVDPVWPGRHQLCCTRSYN